MKRKIVDTIIFIILFFAAFYGVTKVIASASDYRNYQWVKGFYNEPKGSLDAVFIGSSSVYSFYEPPVAFGEYGIATWNFTTNSQQLELAEYMIREAKKRQPNALYVISLNALECGFEQQHLHYITDYMPMSKEKADLISYYCKRARFDDDAKWEYYIPMIRYHSRWGELKKEDFHYGLDGLKGGADFDSYFKNVVDTRESLIMTDEVAELTNDENDFFNIRGTMKSLLDYIDSSGIRVLFLVTPQPALNENEVTKINAMEKMCQDRGYDVLNLYDYLDEIGIDFTCDYQDMHHTNVNGAMKVTDFIAGYLSDNYSMTDKRGNAEYASWDEAYSRYLNLITEKTSEVEEEIEE